MSSKVLDKLVSDPANMPCCGLAAVAAVTNTPLPIIYMHYKRLFNMPDKWRGGTQTTKLCHMLDKYMVKYEARYMQRRQYLENYVRDNPIAYAMVRTTRHIQVVLGDSVLDQGGVKAISSYTLKSKIVSDVWDIKECNLAKDNYTYRALLLVTDGVVTTMAQGELLYERYGKQ